MLSSIPTIVWVYNRVGKSGSSALHPLLSAWCHALEWHPQKTSSWRAFSRDSAALAQRSDGLHGMIARLRAANTSQPCRVLWGHFAWTPPPDDRVRYINMVRDPVTRWLSLRNYFATFTEPHLRSPLDGPACLRRFAEHGNASRACVGGARDAHMADYFYPSEGELQRCDVALVLDKRYSFVAALERQRTDVPRLLEHMGVGERRAHAWSTRGLPRANPTPLSAHAMHGLDAAEREILTAELRCDLSLYGGVLARAEVGLTQI